MVDIMSKAKIAPAGKLNPEDIERIKKNIKVFIIPAVLIYLTALVGIISQQNHIISLKDFIPTNFVIGGMVYYILSTLIDFLRKLLDGPTK